MFLHACEKFIFKRWNLSYRLVGFFADPGYNFIGKRHQVTPFHSCVGRTQPRESVGIVQRIITAWNLEKLACIDRVRQWLECKRYGKHHDHYMETLIIFFWSLTNPIAKIIVPEFLRLLLGTNTLSKLVPSVSSTAICCFSSSPYRAL